MLIRLRRIVGSNPTSGAIRRAAGLLMASGRDDFIMNLQKNSASNGPELVEGPSTACAAGLLMASGRDDFTMNLQKTARRMVPSLSRDIPPPAPLVGPK